MWLLLLAWLFIPKACFAQYAPTLGPVTSTPVPTATPIPTETPSATTPTEIPSPSPSPSITSTPTPTGNPAFQLFNQYLNDYLYQRDLYASAYSAYITAKQVDAKYSTLDTRQQKLDAAKAAIIARGKMIKAYSLVIRVNLDKYKDSNYDQTAKYQDQLLSTEKWLDDQQPLVEKIIEPQDLKKWSTDFKKQYLSIQTTMYTSMVLSEINQCIYIKNQIKDFALTFQNPDSQIFIDEINRQVTKVQTELDAAFTLTQKPQASERFSNFYPASEGRLDTARSIENSMFNNLKYIVSRFGK